MINTGTRFIEFKLSNRATKIAFVVNQLYPGSIGMSPLTTTHPRILPHSPVMPISDVVVTALLTVLHLTSLFFKSEN